MCINTAFLMQKNCEEFCSAKVRHNFSAKNTATTDFVSTVRLTNFWTNDFDPYANNALSNKAQVELN